MNDLRYALRALRNRPGFTAVVLATLALGIGANAVMFSLVNAVLLRPPPYARPDRLVHLWETYTGDVSNHPASYPDFLDWRREGSPFQALEGYDETNVTVSDAGGAARVRGARVTSGFFGMLGGSPALGGTFAPEDDAPGGTYRVMLSHGYWTRRFGAAPDVVGRTLIIDGIPYEIRGVLPRRFYFAPAGDADLWLPLGRNAEARAERFNHWVNVVGRLRDGVTVRQARLRMDQVMRHLAAAYPGTNSGRGAIVRPLREVISGDVTHPLLVLWGAVGVLMLIVCANVASLGLARSLERGPQVALRSALGASRGRLVRQLLVESLVLASAGAALGVWLAAQAVPLLLAALPDGLFDQMPALRDASVDLTALGFTSAIAVATGIACGIAPALFLSNSPPAALLRSDSRTGSGQAQGRTRDALVAAEIALTLVLLVGAALMGRSLVALLRVDPGFTPEGAASVTVHLTGPAYDDAGRRRRFFEDLLARVRVLPGVTDVGAISTPPLQRTGPNAFRVDGAPEPDPAARPEASARAVAGEYFRALRIPIREGRALDVREGVPSPYQVVISESLARHLFGTRTAVGERLRFYGWQDSAWTIVGVVGDVKTDALDEPPAPTIYLSHLQGNESRMTIVARGADPVGLVSLMRREVAALDPGLPASSAGTMTQQIAHSRGMLPRQYLLTLLGAFAVAALLLAMLGVYGVTAYAAAQRRREITIRIALGARRAQVLALLLRDGLRLAGAGIGIGAVAALAVMRTLSALLFGVSPVDAWTYLAVAGTLASVALIASYLPARRATRFDPATALRSE